MIKYPIGLSDSWTEELNKLNALNSKNLVPIKRLIYILFIYDLMIAEINDSHRKYKSDKLIYISRYFLANEYHLGESIYHLVKRGFGVSSSILVRSILENLIDFSYLWLCKDINNSQDERDGWLEYKSITDESIYNKWSDFKKHLSKNGKLFNDYLIVDAVESLQNKAKDFKSKFYKHGNKYHWAKYPSLDQRARQVDMTGRLQKDVDHFYLEQEYIVNYKLNSQLVHGESSMFSSYKDESTNLLSIQSDQDELTKTINLTSNYLLVFAYELVQVNRLKLGIVEQLNYLGFHKKN
ncbi:DUF5677 domain-containing protein [Paenibacillus rhizoplanae]|uniref:DUF5677 domain-containing protein n=1 Tax=Paenibacillus rhizoplanae TaxID=1917181 RepID=A0ABW5FCM3_9BACL